MSRIGSKPITVPDAVDVSLEEDSISVSGPKGELARKIPGGITAALEDDHIVVRRDGEDRKAKALHGLTRALLANMVEGVHEGFSKALLIEGTGYRAQMQGKKLVLTVGFSHPVEMEFADTIEIEVPNQRRIVVRGADKQQVGQVAAEIRAVRPPEPYHGHGIRYDGEHIRRKEGKTAVATT